MKKPFSDKALQTCFSGQCGLCSHCSGGNWKYTLPEHNYWKKPFTNWEKYEKMRKMFRKKNNNSRTL